MANNDNHSLLSFELVTCANPDFFKPRMAKSLANGIYLVVVVGDDDDLFWSNIGNVLSNKFVNFVNLLWDE